MVDDAALEPEPEAPPVEEPAPPPRDRLSEVEAAPTDNPLQATRWMANLLVTAAEEVRTDKTLPTLQRIETLLKIADRVVRLQDPSQLADVDRMLRGQADAIDAPTRGPELTDAEDLYQGASPPPARRGRPPRRAIR